MDQMVIINGVRVRRDEAEALGYVIPDEPKAKAKTPANKARSAENK